MGASNPVVQHPVRRDQTDGIDASRDKNAEEMQALRHSISRSGAKVGVEHPMHLENTKNWRAGKSESIPEVARARQT